MSYLRIDLGCVYFILCDSNVPDELNDLLVCPGFLGEGVSLVLILRGEQLFATWSLCNVKNERIWWFRHLVLLWETIFRKSIWIFRAKKWYFWFFYLLYFKVSLAWKPIFFYILLHYFPPKGVTFINVYRNLMKNTVLDRDQVGLRDFFRIQILTCTK